MPSLMGVQRFATARNDQAEILIDFILQQFTNKLYEDGHIAKPELPVRQKSFVRDDCSDVFDHFLELDFPKPFLGLTGKIQIWGQTTCYKGNELGRAESNKTYEIRETLTESLGLRRWLREEDINFRTVHFTIGPTNYTYGWFKPAKERAFDLSLYPHTNIDTEKLFNELSMLFKGISIEYEFYDQLESNMNNISSEITKYINSTLEQLYSWFLSGLNQDNMADMQANLLNDLRSNQKISVQRALRSSSQGGENIKGQIQDLLGGGETNDLALVRTLQKLNLRNPFLPAALEAELTWPIWSKTNFSIPDNCRDLTSYIYYLWTLQGNKRLINRRLLMRIHTDEPISYIQDINIPGITEHNLYNGEHTPSQTRAIVERIVSSCTNSGIRNPLGLYNILVDQRSLLLLKSSRRFESLNGTNLKPSFFYLEEKLGDEYSFTSFAESNLPPPIAYHGSFPGSQASPYENLKVVVRKKSSAPIAIIKAKFFRRQEFPRRAKEESYVGFTTKFKLDNGVFVERYPSIPLIMFVDMANITPPDFAVRRLVTAGWEVFFSIEALRNYLLDQERTVKNA